jgi:hypothetical protein
MDFLLVPIVIGAIVAVAAAYSRRQAHRCAERRARVSVIAATAASNRDLAATAPRRDAAARARADLHFGYASARSPHYRADVDPDLAQQLRPVQVIRVKDQREREALQRSVPKHMKAVFVVEDETQARVTVRLPRPERPGT